MTKHLILIITLLTTFSCSSFKKVVKAPKVMLEDVKISSMRMNGLNLEIILGVQNPNGIDFDVKNLIYTLDINEKEVTSGKMIGSVLVKAKEKTLVSVPLTLKFSDILSSALMFLKQEGMPYRVKGSAEIGPFTIPFDDSGNLKSADL